MWQQGHRFLTLKNVVVVKSPPLDTGHSKKSHLQTINAIVWKIAQLCVEGAIKPAVKCQSTLSILLPLTLNWLKNLEEAALLPKHQRLRRKEEGGNEQ